MNLPTEKATATTSMNDIVREESVRKRRVLQDEQGEKMKKRHIQNLKDIGSKCLELGAGDLSERHKLNELKGDVQFVFR